MSARRAHLILAAFAGAFALSCMLLAGALAPEGTAATSGKTKIKVMTRNLYLGADLGPAVNSQSPGEFFEANGAILRSVDATDFRKRSRALAAEILKQRPDLVGLQEVALWRTAPPSLDPVANGPSATKVAYDFLKLLLKRLNKGEKRYSVVIVQKEFDFEAPADKNGQPNDGPPGLTKDTEINGRLTMRDVILKRVGAGVKIVAKKKGQFKTLYSAKVGGAVDVVVERGWTRADVRIRDSKLFRFVNTHLEAFGDPEIREAQAKELVANGGPATGRMPVILVGDLNSDDNTVSATNGDRKAYRVVKQAGFRDRATEDPMSCCIKNPLLTGRSAADFDHHIDHILTDAPKQITKIRAGVTGRQRVGGLWPSDHAGVWSLLRVPAKR